MSRSNITVHMIVKNEDRFIWYAIQSVVDFVDKLIIYDTGSSDKTLSIIKSIKNKKIHLSEKQIANKHDISLLRQKQLEETDTDWIWIVDGDEIYPFSLCREIRNTVKYGGKSIEGIVVGRYDLLGDIYHYQKESVGTYNLFDKKAHLVIRLLNIKNINGLHIDGIYPYEGYYDNQGKEVILHRKENYYFTKGKLFHAMYLARSSQTFHNTYNRNKFKIERGLKILDPEKIPEVFLKKTDGVPIVTTRRSNFYEFFSWFITPVKEIKRKIFQ